MQFGTHLLIDGEFHVAHEHGACNLVGVVPMLRLPRLLAGPRPPVWLLRPPPRRRLRHERRPGRVGSRHRPPLLPDWRRAPLAGLRRLWLLVSRRRPLLEALRLGPRLLHRVMAADRAGLAVALCAL